jgi:ATP/maltotriose-dependent transcriptional regulator MalT
MARALLRMGRAALYAGERSEAGQVIDAARVIYEEIRHRAGTAEALELLSRCAVDLDTAREALFRSFDLRRQMGDRAGLAAIWGRLGDIAFQRGDYAEARRCVEESLALLRERGTPEEIAMTLASLGDAAHALGEWDEAAAYFQESLRLSTARGATAITLGTLAGASALLRRRGETDLAAAALALAYHHPAGDDSAREIAGKLLGSLKLELAPELFAALRDHTQTRAALELHAPALAHALGVGVGALHELIHALPGLPAELLSEREQAVLRLMAEGLSNQEIGASLHLTEGTVRRCLYHLFDKLKVHTRAQAAHHARELGLL